MLVLHRLEDPRRIKPCCACCCLHQHSATQLICVESINVPFCDSILYPHMDPQKWRGVRLMTLGRLSVMSEIHTPERQHKSQLAMSSLHMAVTICLTESHQTQIHHHFFLELQQCAYVCYCSWILLLLIAILQNALTNWLGENLHMYYIPWKCCLFFLIYPLFHYPL